MLQDSSKKQSVLLLLSRVTIFFSFSLILSCFSYCLGVSIALIWLMLSPKFPILKESSFYPLFYLAFDLTIFLILSAIAFLNYYGLSAMTTL